MKKLLPLAAVALGLLACGGGEVGKLPRIDLDPPAVDTQIESVYALAIRNTGNMALTIISEPTLVSEPCEGDEPGYNPFRLTVQAAGGFPMWINPREGVGGVDEGVDQLDLLVEFLGGSLECDRAAVITIASDDAERPNLSVTLRVSRGVPLIGANPEVLDMGYVAEGQSADDMLTVLNSGQGDLLIHAVHFAGDEGFSFQWKCRRKDSTPNDRPIPISPSGGIVDDTVCEPVVLPANSSFQVPVRYQAIHGERASATLIFMSNDPTLDASAGRGLDVEVRANYGGPCVKVTPSPVDFGSVVVGKPKFINVYLESCSDEDTSVTEVKLSPETSREFEINLATLGSFNEANPLVLAPGGRRDFKVMCMPQDVGVTSDGKPEPDTGYIVVHSNSPRGALEVPVSCLGVEASCATCVMEVTAANKPVQDGDTVRPMTILKFTDHSFDPSGVGITSRVWSVEQPPGSQQIYSPSYTFPTPNFQPNVVGEYIFTLTVINADGCKDTCSRLVRVLPPEGCHIELTWNTPADADQTDQCYEDNDCGSDMDLHVVHPYATGSKKDQDGAPYGYFDSPYDCFWNNAHPVWRDDHADDPLFQPHLDLDDTDGAGPENFTYTFPEVGKCYRVGAHYYNDHGFGLSYPTIRVYVDSNVPIYEKTLAKGMKMLDMWDVGKVCCTDKTFVEHKKAPAYTEPVIVENYSYLSIP